MGPQIEGQEGRVANVFGEKEETNLPSQNMGEGEGTAVAMGQMLRNRAAYDFDQGSPESLLMPLVGYPAPAAGVMKKPTDKTIET